MTQRRVRFLLALILTAAAATGCDGLLDSTTEFAENARITVTGSSPVPLQLILSNRFTAVADPETGRITNTVQTADTLNLELPIDRTFPLGDDLRILARLEQPDSTQTATIRMRVLLDEELKFDQQASLRDASIEYAFRYR